MNTQITDHLLRGHIFTIECYDPQGRLKWKDTAPNLVVDEGLDELLNRSYNGATVADAVGLTDGTPTIAAGDTMGSHAGWAEVTAYDEAARPALNMGTAASQSIDNSANKANYTISTNGTTIGGAFISTDNTKGGTTGILIAGAAFDAGDKTIDAADTLAVTVTATASSS